MDWQEAIGSSERWTRLLGWALALGLICGVVGPFGSYPANGFTRIAYWTGLFVIGTLLLWPMLAMAIAVAARRGVPAALPVGVALALGSLPIAALAAAGGLFFWPVHAGAMRALEWYGQTLCLAVPAAAAVLWLEVKRPVAGAPARAMEDEAGAPALPPALLQTALCLQMEDHHVRVHGPDFSRLCHATLREATAQIGEDRGLQVHRSWWVARDAVAGWAEDGRQLRLRLSNGLEVPVARSRVATLRASGWLPAAAAQRRSAARPA